MHSQNMQPHTTNNTFRGLGDSGMRSALFAKTFGEIEVQRQLLKVESPISGNTLTLTTAADGTPFIKDPISGTTLQLHQTGGHAEVVAPVLRQEKVHARNFYLRNDVEIQITQLRKTNGINRHTNEKLGTAGTPTGLDKALLSGTKLRCQQQQQQQQPEQEVLQQLSHE